MMRTLCVGLFAAASVLFGQLESNSITITASRSVYLKPDQVVFSVSVISPPNATLDDIVAALQGSGITAANLSGSSTFFAGVLGDQTFWDFTLPTPFANMKNTIASLTTIQLAIAQKNGGLSLNFIVQGTQVSAQLKEAQQCPLADLVSDARTQAQTLALASGLTSGPILAMSNGSSAVNVVAAQFFNPFLFAIPTAVVRVPIIDPTTTTTTSATTTSTTSIPAFTTPALTCSITVKFALLRYQ